ncbi:MAG: von Willebrand factor type A domain-containing protein [Bacteroidota bacterium]
MENQDKLYNEFKDAAQKAEDKGFARMDAVWNRVEDKLDNKKQRRIAAWWKYTGIAALLLLFTGIGFMLLKSNTDVIIPQAKPDSGVTVIDTQKVKEVTTPPAIKQKETVVVNDTEKQSTSTDGSNIIEGDSISFNTVTKKARIWSSKSDKGEFRVKAEITEKGIAGTNLEEVVIDKYRTTGRATNSNAVTTVTSKTIEGRPNASFTQTVQGQAPGLNITNGAYNSASSNMSQGYISNTSKNYTNADKKLGYEYTKTMDPANTQTYTPTEADILQKAEVGNVALGKKAQDDAYKNSTEKSYGKPEEIVSKALQGTVSGVIVDSKPNANFIQTLQGQVPGLNISTGSGQPGANSTVVIRGIGSINGNIEPLYVIDGVPMNSDNFRQLNPNDIESVSVLKDAGATSIYGNRGINGVIVVKTKNGSATQVTKEELEKVKSIEDTELTEDKQIIDAVKNLSNGQPGEPMVLVNGIRMKKQLLRKIKPEDIESAVILDSSYGSAVYGKDGKPGVIIIKTKTRTALQQQELDKLNKNLEQLGKGGYKEYKYLDVPKIPIDTNNDESYEKFEENKFENPATTPLSTFSIDVDNASYTNIRRFLNNGQTVPKDAVRVEEMVNYFKYQYPQPTGNDPFSINTEYSDCPWNANHKLLKIGLQGYEIPTTQLAASNFVFLIDVSGSMGDSNKLPLLRESMKILVKNMRKEDRLAIVVYAGAAGLVLPSTSGADKNKIYEALDRLNAGGSTAGGAGIELAYKTAQENFVKGGNNRVILATDGDFNVGASSDGDMQTLIEAKRKSGVFLTCLGYGMGNYKDSKLEILADKGNGNYAYIDNMQEADRFLDKEFKGSMYAIAKDVKIQIEFNPKHVQSYRLIGYENRKLRDEDFVNDAIDAGELGSGHTVTALYEIIPTGVQSNYFNAAPELKYSTPATTATGNYNNELATIKFRYKKPDGDKSTEMIKVIPNISLPAASTSADFKFSAAVTWFGLKLRDSSLVPDKSTENILKLAKEGLMNDPEGYRAEFIRLVNRVE